MTGIERLRELGNDYVEHSWSEVGKRRGMLILDIADQIERESDVETVRSDAMEAWEWMREHGGLDYVRREWRSRVPYDLYERRRQRLLDHIAECETALGRRNERIEELGCRIDDLTTENAGLRRRAMPEGMELDGNVLRIRTAENVDYNGETLFVLIGGRDE